MKLSSKESIIREEIDRRLDLYLNIDRDEAYNHLRSELAEIKRQKCEFMENKDSFRISADDVVAHTSLLGHIKRTDIPDPVGNRVACLTDFSLILKRFDVDIADKLKQIYSLRVGLDWVDRHVILLNAREKEYMRLRYVYPHCIDKNTHQKLTKRQIQGLLNIYRERTLWDIIRNFYRKMM